MRLLPVPGVFQPHSDTLTLAEAMEREALAGAAVLDLCTGSGMLAIHAALNGARRVVAVDVSRRALLSARLNAAINGVWVTTRCGNLLEAVGAERFDLIVSNPPYLPGPDDKLALRGPERAWEAGRTGRYYIEKICAGAAAFLNPRGILLLVLSSVCGVEETAALLIKQGMQTSVARSERGPLGPRLSARAEWLRARGLLPGEKDEELVVVLRAQLPDLRYSRLRNSSLPCSPPLRLAP